MLIEFVLRIWLYFTKSEQFIYFKKYTKGLLLTWVIKSRKIEREIKNVRQKDLVLQP